MLGLAIDTTFDDTSIAILQGERKLLANLTLSQYEDHAEFGGVVPERASRKHMEVIHKLIEVALQESQITINQLDYIAVSHCPGLIGAILVGVSVSKAMSYSLQIPLIGVNHVQAHPYANDLVHGQLPHPIIHLVVAGGHTLLFHSQEEFHFQIIGRSRDDAAGECVDKVAKMFGYPMPGGQVVDQFAVNFPDDTYAFPRPMIDTSDYHFSFSGLKTAMLRFREQNHSILQEQKGLILSSFFRSIADVLISKTFRACCDLGVKNISVSGGLAASNRLKFLFEKEARAQKMNLFYPPPKLCTDNAGMVACLGAKFFQANKISSLDLEVAANLAP